MIPTGKPEDGGVVRLKHVVDRHKGEKFLICGTGPSIDQYHRSFYESWPGITIGVNDILDLFMPDYYLNIHNDERILWCHMEGKEGGIHFSYHNPSTRVDLEKNGELSIVGTVAFTAMSAAYQLGASEINLIGIDCKLRHGQSHFEGCSSVLVPGGTHFIEKSFELEGTIRSFERAISEYQTQGIKVFNLSKDSLICVNSI